MTEKLMASGIEGAEVLSDIINHLFSIFGDIITGNGGFITKYAGDSFFALFRGPESQIRALSSAFDILGLIKENYVVRTRLGDFRIKGKFALGHGNIEWDIVYGENILSTYYFKGEAFENSIRCMKTGGPLRIIIDHDLNEKLALTNTKKLNDYAYEIEEFYPLICEKKPNLIKCDFNKVYSSFFPQELLQGGKSGEFRDVAHLFIGFETLPKNIVACVKGLANTYGKHNFRVIYGDKGHTILVLFGAPVQYENNIERAVNLALNIRQNIKNRHKAGISYGRVFSGMIGNNLLYCYDVLGPAVNLSARLMESAEYGDIIVTRPVYEKIKEKFEIRFIKESLFKGFKSPVPVFSLLNKKTIRESQFFNNQMVGRENEKNKIISSSRPVFNGKFAGLTYIYGPAGIGKSRLCYEVLSELQSSARIFILQADNIIKKGFNPFEYALRDYFGLYLEKDYVGQKRIFESIFKKLVDELEKRTSYDERVSRIIDELNRTRVIMAAIAGLHIPDKGYASMDSKTRYENAIYAIKNFFKAQSFLRPVIVLFDDLHWIDDLSREAIEILTRNIDDYPIHIIIASRFKDDGSKPGLNIGGSIAANEIVLNNLSENDISVFLQNQLNSPISRELLDFIIEKTLGNPFYIEQFAYYLTENKLLRTENGVLCLIDDNFDIPSSITEIIISKIDRLSYEHKKLIQTASVLGKEFEINVLKDLMLNYSDQYRLKDINGLINDSIKEQIWAPISEITYIFRHTLLYEAVYNMQMKSQLRQTHKLAAGVLLSLYSNKKERYAEMAHHYHFSEQIRPAIKYYLKAARFHRSIYDNNKAIDIYKKLLFLLKDKARQKMHICLNIADIMLNIGKWDDALGILSEAFEINKTQNDEYLKYKIDIKKAMVFIKKCKYKHSLEILLPMTEDLYKHKDIKFQGLLPAIYGFIGNNYHALSNYDQALSYYEKQMSSLNVPFMLSRALCHAGLIYYELGEFDKAEQYYMQAIELKKNEPADNELDSVYLNLGLLQWNKGNFNKAIEFYGLAREISKKMGNRANLALIAGNMGNVYFEQNRFEQALDCYLYLKDICIELGDTRGLAMAYSNIGSIYFEFRSDIDSAEKYFLKATELFIEISEKIGRNVTYANLGRLYTEKGNYDRAEEYLRECITLSDETNNGPAKILALRLFSELFYKKNEYEKSIEYARKGLELSKDLNSDSQLFDLMICEARVIGLHDKDKALNMLSILMGQVESDMEKAYVSYELFRLTQNNCYKSYACSYFKKLHKQNRLPKYIKFMKELCD